MDYQQLALTMGLIVLLIKLFHQMWESRPSIDMPLFVHDMSSNVGIKYNPCQFDDMSIRRLY
jgi:hypothetical protein